MQVSISVTKALLGVNASPSKLYQSITCSQSHYVHCPLKEQLNISCSGHVINAKLSLTNYSPQVFLGLINLSFKPKAALVLSAGNAQLEIQHVIIVLMIYINKTIETKESEREVCALSFRGDKSLWLCVNYSTGSGPGGNLSIIKLQ